jgi:hypothetical protein
METKKKLYRIASNPVNLFTYYNTNSIGFVEVFTIEDYTNMSVRHLEKGKTYTKGLSFWRNPIHIVDLYDVKFEGLLVGV